MNDHSEGLIIERALMRWIADDLENNDPPQFTDSAAMKIKEALAVGRPELYACCFSRERDSTTQWLNYADKGKGFAIGFDADSIRQNRILPWNHSTFDGEKYVIPVRFSQDPEERLSLTPVLYVDDSSADSILGANLWGKVREFIDGGSPNAMVNTATFYSSIAKDASFRHENEYRLVYAPSVMPLPPGQLGEPIVTGTVKPLKWRSSGYGVTPYFEYEFNVDAIREVWIGPANPEHNDHAARHLISTMLNLNGFWGMQLLESRSPYR